MKLNKTKYELARARSCKSFKDIVNAGVSRTTLCRAMNGEDVRPEIIGKISKVLKVDVTEILED